jgi:3-hydroxyisobutyrate dehydrogenase-like beta-hydroxyacid dehydrogenase
MSHVAKRQETQKDGGTRLAFLGLGNMGCPMAARCVEAGFAVSVWNRTTRRTERLERMGARVAENPADAARGADVVVTMLADGASLLRVLGGPRGLLAGLRRGALVIDMSTSGRAAAHEAARRVRLARGRFVDAPVSGTVAPATRGELVAMVGGAKKDVRDAEPVLRAMCKRQILAGGVGQGQTLKVLLNGIGAHHFVAFGSMLALGERAGLSRETIVDAFTSGAFASPSYIGKRAKVLARDYAPEFSLALALKDAKLNIELQDEVGLRLDVLRTIARTLQSAVRGGLGEQDLYAIEKWFEGR